MPSGREQTDPPHTECPRGRGVAPRQFGWLGTVSDRGVTQRREGRSPTVEEWARRTDGEVGWLSAEDGRPGIVRLEDLTPGARVSGIGGRGEVGVVDIQWHGTNAVTVVYRTDDGRIDEALLYRDREPELRLAKASMSSAFDADPNDFKLAAEALRIRMAARFDPMLAVSSSDLEPLPHQLKAVYGELLPRTATADSAAVPVGGRR